jgi:hypothetical protein
MLIIGLLEKKAKVAADAIIAEVPEEKEIQHGQRDLFGNKNDSRTKYRL